MRIISAVLAMLLLSCGCSSFDQQWNALAAQPAPSREIEGRWRGTWVSDASGHSGALLAAIRKTAENQYLAAFNATYAGVFHFSYDLPLVAQRRDGVTYFHGEADLGLLAGGVYRYDGHATDTDFLCTYTSKYDYGDFVLRRVGSPSEK